MGIHRVLPRGEPLETMQFMGTNESAVSITEWVDQSEDSNDWDVIQTQSRKRNTLRVITPICDVSVRTLDWLVKHNDGHFRVYPPHEFGTLFEFVGDDE